MKEDLISRQAVIDALERRKDKTANGEIGSFYNTIIQHDIDVIAELPSAQSDVPDTNVGNIISRQAAIDALINELNTKPSYYWDNGLNQYDVESTLKAIPSADVQTVRHGHWMLYEAQNQDDVNNGNYLYICSNCNHSDIHAKTVDVPYCPHCGAIMDGEQHE